MGKFKIASVSNDSDWGAGISRPSYRIYWDATGIAMSSWDRREGKLTPIWTQFGGGTVYETAEAAWAEVERVEQKHLRDPQFKPGYYDKQRWGYVVEIDENGREVSQDHLPKHLRIGE